jgi:WD40 repeat protein
MSLLAVSAERVLASRCEELDPVLELLDIVAQQLVTSWSAPAVYSSLALLPLDGGQAQSLVAAGRNGLRGRIAEGTACIDIWDLTVGACVRSFSAGHTSSVHELRMLPAAAHADGAAQCARLLSSSYRDRTHRVWDLQSGTCLLTVSFDDANGVQDAADTRIGVPLSTDRHVFIPRAGGVYLDSKVTATMAFQHSVEGEQKHTVVCVGTKSGAVHIFRTECGSEADAAVQRAARRAEAPPEAGHGQGAYES